MTSGGYAPVYEPGADRGAPPGPRHAEGISKYYRTLRENVLLIVACVVVCVAAAGIYVAVAPRTYTAQAELLVSPAPSSDNTLFGLPVLHATADPTRDVLTAATLVTTTQVANAVIDQLNLHTTPGEVLQHITVTPIAQSNLLAVQATASTPEGAQKLANAFATQVVAVRTDALHKAIAAIIPGLQAQVAALPPAQRNGAGTLGDQLSQLQQLQSSNDPTLSVASLADLPTAPSSPRTKLALAAGLFGGLILGIAAAFAWSALDPRVKREEQIRDVLRAPILARIPQVRARRRPRPLVPDELPFQAIEGYRTLRTMLTSRAGGQPQALLVTGSAPSEGKSTTALCLAVALAQGGSRVILIEADLRRPTFSGVLGLDPQYSTDQVLINEVTLEEALVPVKIDGAPLRVLASYRAGVELADRLSVAVARRLVADAKQLADVVVIDSPPMTTVIDALPLAQFSDEILVVARLGHSRVGKLIELDELFRAHGTYATGVVLVGVDNKQYGYSHYYSEAQGPRGEQRGGDEPRRGEQSVPVG
jgi:non-specific protein-tyrosine kinase